MGDLISRSALLEEMKRMQMDIVAKATAIKTINWQPTVEERPRGGYEQILWERDIAIKQLEDIGLSLGEKTDRVKEALEKQAGIERALKRLEEKLSQKHKLMLREDRDEIRYFYEMQMLKEAIEILKEEVG